MEVFGENASVAFCYLLATLFRDIIFRRTRHFPILNLFGEKGTGKTTLAVSLQSFFLHGVDPAQPWSNLCTGHERPCVTGRQYSCRAGRI